MRHVWGAGTHNGSQAASVFPDAIRWLWRDYPAPLEAGTSDNPVLRAILKPGSDWALVAEGCARTNYLAANEQGQVFYAGLASGAPAQMLGEGAGATCVASDQGASLAFGADGTLLRTNAIGGITVTRTENSATNRQTLAPNLRVRNFTVRWNGDIYATTHASDDNDDLWFIPSNGEPQRVAEGLKGASGLALSPDGLWLFVPLGESHFGMSYRVRSDGTLDDGEPFYHFYVPDWADDSGAGSVAMDGDGRAYVATRMGIQVFDRNGRVTAILPLPRNEQATGVCFGGRGFDTLYVTAGGKVYKRKLIVAGAPPWRPPIKLAEGNAG